MKKKILGLVTLAAAYAQVAQAGEVQCSLISGKKVVNQSLTEISGIPVVEGSRREFSIAVKAPDECVKNPSSCEGGSAKSAHLDQYQDVGGEKVRTIMNYEEWGNLTLEVRVRTSAAYAFSEGATAAVLQLDDVVYSLICNPPADHLP